MSELSDANYRSLPRPWLLSLATSATPFSYVAERMVARLALGVTWLTRHDESWHHHRLHIGGGP